MHLSMMWERMNELEGTQRYFEYLGAEREAEVVRNKHLAQWLRDAELMADIKLRHAHTKLKGKYYDLESSIRVMINNHEDVLESVSPEQRRQWREGEMDTWQFLKLLGDNIFQFDS
jgi:hypothetical protein